MFRVQKYSRRIDIVAEIQFQAVDLKMGWSDMNKFRLSSCLLSIFVAGLIGCASPYIIKSAYNEVDFRPFAVKGDAVLNGQAFLKTQGGDVKFAAGEKIELIPKTAYTSELMATWGEPLANLDKGWRQHIRTVVADASGNFEFKNIPAGSYYVQTYITWKYATSMGLQTTGGRVTQELTIGAAETKKVVLTE
jgi:hypothetical protein